MYFLYIDIHNPFHQKQTIPVQGNYWKKYNKIITITYALYSDTCCHDIRERILYYTTRKKICNIST